MNYQKIHDSIITNASKRTLIGYKERHHIIPRCIGGTNEKTNLVDLTAREHFIIHQLLIKIYPNNKSLIRAVNMMCVDKTGNRLNNRRYEWIKKKNAKVMSENRKGKNKNNDLGVLQGAKKRSGENHPFFNQTKDNNDKIKKLSELNSNRTKENNEGRREQSKKTSGDNHWTKTNKLSLQKLSDSKKGKNKQNDVGRKISAEKQTKINEPLRKELVIKRNSGETFKEIHQWLLSLGINVTILTIRRTFNREIGIIPKRGGQKILSDEMINDIINKHNQGISIKQIYNDIISLGIKISFQTVKNIFKEHS